MTVTGGDPQMPSQSSEAMWGNERLQNVQFYSTINQFRPFIFR